MTRLNRNRAVAGIVPPSRSHVAAFQREAARSEQALINHIALAPFSGDAWIDRYRERPSTRWRAPAATAFIPVQRGAGTERDRIRAARAARPKEPNARRR